MKTVPREELLTTEGIKKLMKHEDRPCVSIYIPTHRKFAETRPDHIRFKNAIHEAKKCLLEMEMDRTGIWENLDQAENLLEDLDFWKNMKEGLSVFLAPETFIYYRAPREFDFQVTVSDRFHIKPLLSILGDLSQYYVLALNLSGVKLYESSRFEMKEVDLENAPDSIEEALKYDDPERTVQFHTGTSGRGGTRSAVYHGQGVGTDASRRKKNILRYFHQVNEALHQKIKGETIPLVLAGVEYLVPIYKEANSYPHIMEEWVEVNPESIPGEELHQRSLEVIKPHLQKAKKEAIEKYERLAKTDKASDDLKDVALASGFGKVEFSFTASDVQKWGVIDLDNNKVEIHDKWQYGDTDLFDYIAAETFLHGGTTYVVESDKIPGDKDVAAVYRY